MSLFCPCREGQPFNRYPQIGLVHDVVAVEDRARFVASELHRDLLRHAGPHEVSYRRPPEIVGDAPGITCSRASLPPRFPKGVARGLMRVEERPACTVEDPRAYRRVGLGLVLLLKRGPQLRQSVEQEGPPASFFVVSGSRRTTPAAKSTWRHWSVRISDGTRQPVTYANVATFFKSSGR